MSGDLIRSFVRTLLEVDEKVIQYVNKMRASTLPFESVFQGKKRLAIPAPSKEINSIVKKLEKKGYEVDLVNNMATKGGQTMRLGKVIGRELGQEMVDAFAKSGGAMSIIVSRVPIDVLRMSDFEQIQSCMSQGGDYFSCTIEEAEQGGAVAFVVRNKDLKTVDLEADEIFEDDERGIDGIKPISRMRLRRFVDMEDLEDIAVPDTETYGHQITGFREALTKWAKETQPKMRSKKKGEWTMVGAATDADPKKMLKAVGVTGILTGDEEAAREAISGFIAEKEYKKYQDLFKKWNKEVKRRLKALGKEKKIPIVSIAIDKEDREIYLSFNVSDSNREYVNDKIWKDVLGSSRSFFDDPTYSISLSPKDERMERKIGEFLKKVAVVLDQINEKKAKEPKKKKKKKTTKKSKKKKKFELSPQQAKAQKRLIELDKIFISFYRHIDEELIKSRRWEDDPTVRERWLESVRDEIMSIDYGVDSDGGLRCVHDLDSFESSLGFFVDNRRAARRYLGAQPVTQYINTLREVIQIAKSWESMSVPEQEEDEDEEEFTGLDWLPESLGY